MAPQDSCATKFIYEIYIFPKFLKQVYHEIIYMDSKYK